MKDFLIRAETREAWLAYAAQSGWMGDIEGAPYPMPHVGVDEIGPVVVTPGVYDEDGVEVTPPVMDNWHHVNLRVIEVLEPDNQPFSHLFAVGRAVVTPQDVRAIEGDTPDGAIQVLYPADIETPIRIWADGMHHADLPEPPLP